MLNENAKKWVAALRSGDYKQGKFVLHNETEDKFCCLGVACEIYLKEGNRLEIFRMQAPGGIIATVYQDKLGELPSKVRKWLGLNTSDGLYEQANRAKQLTVRNDGGYTFEQIADIIESEPSGLFTE